MPDDHAAVLSHRHRSQPAATHQLSLRAGACATATSLLLLISGCGQQGQDAHAAAMQMPPAAVSVWRTTMADLPVSFVHTGQTAASREVEIRARVSGILEKRLFVEGANLKAGDALVELDAAPFQARAALAQAELAQAEARLAQDQRRAKRILALLDQRVVSSQDADNARSSVTLAHAAVQAAQARLRSAKLDLSYTTVRAPISGRIGRALKTEGALLESTGNSLIATMAQLDPIHVEFSIPENDRLAREAQLAAGQLSMPDSGFELAIELADGRLLDRTGHIEFVDHQANAQTGGFGMRGTITNADGSLRPGQFVRVHLRGAVRRNAIAIPQRAVLDGPTGKFVYVAIEQDGKQLAQPRPVEVGAWIRLPEGQGEPGNAWIIESGLKADEQVIVAGAAKLRPMQPIAPDKAMPADPPATPAESESKR